MPIGDNEPTDGVAGLGLGRGGIAAVAVGGGPPAEVEDARSHLSDGESSRQSD